MMDSDDLKVVDGHEVAHQNGVHKQLVASGEDEAVAGDLNQTIAETARSNEDSESVHKSDESGTAGKVTEGENDNLESNGLVVAKSGEGKDAGGNTSKQSVPQKGHGKNKTERLSNPKRVSSTGVKKSKDVKNAEAMSTVSNGSTGLNSNSKQSFKSRSFNDRQAQVSKQSGKSDTPSEGLAEKTKSKSSKKGPPEKAEKDLGYKSDDSKSRRVGALPNYGFSFRCDERAEKRREFYTKLEEKVHAKELEKNNLQAKSKESQEAEIKMLRKSLNFKATPMPSFYQEPPLPKVELKKIPTTRAKSPKLGRRKSTTPVDSEDDSTNCRPGRLSLDAKGPQSNSVRGISPVNPKKPQRKSLPKLPSEKATISSSRKEEMVTSSKAAANEETTSSSKPADEENTTSSKAAIARNTKSSKAANKKNTKSKAANEENTTSPDATEEAASPTEEQEQVPTAEEQEQVPTAEPEETQSHTDEGLEVEEQAQPILVQEPVALEN